MRADGWRLRTRLTVAALSGLALTAAFPPFDLGWPALVALVPLFLAISRARARTGVLAGFVFGLFFFGVLLYWISSVGYAAFIALTVVMSVWTAAFGACGARLWQRGPIARIAGIPLLWTGIEFLRGRYPLGGFTWGSLGYTQHAGGTLRHLAPVGGVYLVSAALVLLNVVIVELLTRPTRRERVALAIALAMLLLAPGAVRLGLAGPQVGTIDLAAVQGNVPRERFTGIGRRGRVGPEDFTIVDNHRRVTERLLGSARPDLIVWPENSFDRDPRLTPEMFDPVVRLLGRIGAPLLAGAILDADDRFTNSNILIQPDGGITQRYDKIHLVPFGEYVPIEFVRRIVPALDRELPTDGIPGTHPVIFRVGAARIGTVICFESTYPDLARDVIRDGAQVLVVTTNNASFGTSPAAREHLAMSQMRAVEHGRVVVHDAIAGISAIIGPDGRIRQRAGLFRPALLRARVPLTDGQTPYTRYGSLIELAFVLGAAIAAAAGFARRR